MKRKTGVPVWIVLFLIAVCAVLIAQMCHASAMMRYFCNMIGVRDTVILTNNRNTKGNITCFDINTGRIRRSRHFDDYLGSMIYTSSSFVYAFGSREVLNLKDGSIRKQFTYKDEPECVTITPNMFVTSRRVKHADQILEAYDTTHFRKLWQSRLKYCDVYKIISRGKEFDVLITDPQFFMRNEPDRNEGGVYPNMAETTIYPGYLVASIDVPGTSYYVNSFRIVTIRGSDGKIVKDRKVKNFDGLYKGSLFGLFGEDDRLLPDSLPKAIKRSIYNMFGTLDNPVYPIWRTKLVNNDKNWFVGKINQNKDKGTVFALDGDTGKIIWKREVPEFQEILTYKGKLVAASFMADMFGPSKSSKKNKLIALDVKTGKVCWTTVVGE